LQIKSVSTWGTLRKNYDTAAFARAVAIFDGEAEQMKGSETYRIDRINFLRQVLANRADIVFGEVVRAYEGRDSIHFKKAAGKFLALHDQSDVLLRGHSYYRLDAYKRRAVNAGETPEEKKNNLLNALMLITYWGENNRKEDNLHEYAYKEWGGMMKSFYKRRWELYFNYLLGQLRGEKVPEPDWFGWERAWVERERGGL
jgi:alpha-N-acetylglucosaminidase